MSVGDAKGEVGVGEEVDLRFHFHHTLDVGAHESLNVGVGTSVVGQLLCVVGEGVSLVE